MNFKEWLLTEEQIFNEDFKTQRDKFIQQGIEPNIVDAYLNNFRTIKDKKYKQINDQIHGLEHIKDRTNIDNYKTWNELETLVDYVKGQTDVSGKTSYKNIKVDAEPIHEDNDLVIYYADTPQACVTYKGAIPYSWCVARSDASNMFYNYRFKEQEPAFYFVKNKERTNKEIETFKGGTFTDKYHFFVIQVIKYANPKNKDQKQYVVTSASNDGDKQMSWNDILKLEPKLNNKQNIFISNPLSEKEKELYQRFINGISDKEFEKLPYDEKDMYLNVYVRQDRPITANQFKNLPTDLKNKYIGFGVGLSDEQIKMIDPKLYTRYEDVTKTKIEKTIGTDDEIKFTPSEADIFLKHASEFDVSKLSDENFRGILLSGHLDLVDYLVTENPKIINIHTVQHAASSGNIDLVKYLIHEKKAPIGDSSVANAAENDDFEMVDYLVKNGATISDVAVGYAAKKSNIEMIKYLIDKKGGNIPNNSVSIAAIGGNQAIDGVKYLLGDELLDKQGNIVKLPQEIKPASLGFAADKAAYGSDMYNYLITKNASRH